jgi:hypothetical protein
VYALGVVLYELLTGERPFRGSRLEVMAQAQFADPKPPSGVRPGLDPALDAICLKAMAKKPEDRFPSARELAAALGDYLRSTSAGEVSDSGFPALRSPAPPPSEVAAELGTDPPVTTAATGPPASDPPPPPEVRDQPRRRERSGRKAVPHRRRVRAVVACAAALVLGGIAYVVVTRPDPETTTDAGSPAKPPGPAAPVVEWRKFTARNGGFKAQVPGDPVELDLPVLGLAKGKGKGFAKSVVAGGQVVTAASGNGEVTVKAIGVRFVGAAGAERERVLDEFARVILGGGSAGRGEVRSRRVVKWLGQDTEEVVMAFPAGAGSDPTETAFRTAVVGSYGYVGAVSGKHRRADPESEKKFFDAFEVLR